MFHVESYLASCSHDVFVVNIVIASLVEERAGLYASRAFVYFSHIPMPTRLSHPCVYSLSAQSIPHRCLCEISVAMYSR